MGSGIRITAITLSVLVWLAGLLAPLAAAQQPPPSPLPPQPGIFQETPKMAPEYARRPLDNRLPPGAYDVAAGVATAFLVPGRAITCVMGGAIGVVSLLATFGSGYRFATNIVEEGCGGKWIVTGSDLQPDRPLPERP